MTYNAKQIYALIREVPKGEVASYGMIGYSGGLCDSRRNTLISGSGTLQA